MGNKRPVDAPTIEQLNDEIRDATLLVHQAQERQDERDVVMSALEAVERTAQRYRDLIQSIPEAERQQADRLLGRRIMDLKRLGSLLPKVPTATTESTPDRVVGAGAIGQRRITGVSWSPQDRAGPSTTARVGSDIEAWCGKCGDTTTHSIVAMVGTEPKQILCQVCSSRHTYRTGPARKRSTGEATAVGEGDSRPRVAVDPEAQRRAANLRALGEEVAAAQDVRRFDPKERYKAGEIISHPVYGRGKIENVLRSSLLVRFSAGGLKSLMLS
ncbi:MAG: hypothetical protein JWM82_2353 [Myxococcales bacterium]|nr:hypothetical protein [Myxococcales bacterium]